MPVDILGYVGGVKTDFFCKLRLRQACKPHKMAHTAYHRGGLLFVKRYLFSKF